MDVNYARVTRHCSEVGGWERASGRPDPRLRPFVVGYEGYRDTALGFQARLEVSKPAVVLIINFGTPFRLSGPVHPAGGASFDSFVAGVTDTYTNVAASGPAYTLQVNFTPLGAFRFFGVSMYDLSNRVVAPGEVDSALGRHFVAQLYETPSWEGRFALVEQLVFDRVTRSQDTLIDVVAWAWRQLLDSQGQCSIGLLAEEAGCSHKLFVARFREQMGLPPKTLARILRFENAARLARQASAPDWPALARACGYYDQAHLIKDFRQFAGVTPVEYQRRVLPGDGGVLAE